MPVRACLQGVAPPLSGAAGLIPRSAKGMGLTPSEQSWQSILVPLPLLSQYEA
jgi:hypothetical protein